MIVYCRKAQSVHICSLYVAQIHESILCLTGSEWDKWREDKRCFPSSNLRVHLSNRDQRLYKNLQQACEEIYPPRKALDHSPPEDGRTLSLQHMLQQKKSSRHTIPQNTRCRVPLQLWLAVNCCMWASYQVLTSFGGHHDQILSCPFST